MCSQRRGEQIIRAAAVEQANRTPFIGSRVAACVAATFVLMAGTAGSAGAALPGQPLYSLKQMVERAMIAVTADDVEAARLELRFAERGLEEASAVTAEEDTLTQRFNEHINAANALGGEVERLQTTQQYEEPSVANQPPAEPVAPSAPQPPAANGVARRHSDSDRIADAVRVGLAVTERIRSGRPRDRRVREAAVAAGRASPAGTNVAECWMTGLLRSEVQQ